LSIDIHLLRLGKTRKNFNRLNPGLPEAGIEETTLKVWRSMQAFFDEFPECEALHLPTFKTWFTEFKHQTLPESDVPIYTGLIDRMKEDVPPDLESGLMERLLQSELAVEVTGTLERYSSGDEVDVHTAIQGALDAYKDRLDRKVRTPLVQEDLDDLMEADEHNSGINWRLHALRRSMRPLRGGDFGIWAARPDRGKTTGQASECSYWTPQLDTVWPGEDRVGIWFNNEGPGKRIKQRYYQAALGVTLPEMVEMHKEGKLEPALVAVLGEYFRTRMLFFDVHGFWSHEVEAIIKQYKPGFVIFDMIDNIKFSGMTNNNGQRTDQLLEEMYKWGRNLAVKHDFAGVAASQISAEGEGVPYPPQSALKDSKTGKQGACDFIIMQGALNDPAMDRVRYMGVPKNKLHRSGAPRDPRCEVVFDAERARLYDPED
jgi:replicative DNA helicase